ncbi:MAG: fibronectin type III domain-containing protein [Nitrosomonas sp.]|nr:fibronectin type III domain-containing protein [Nitrosomonas sp.]
MFLLWRFIALPISQGKFLGIRVACSNDPIAPTNLGGRIVNGTSITVQWTKTPQTDSYILYLGRTANFSTTSSDREISTETNTVTVNNLVPGRYYFKVVAVNTCGQSGFSTEILVTVTEWPTTFKICKADDPTLCLLMQSDGAYARLSKECPNNQCNVEYAGNNFIRSSGRNLCLFSSRDSTTALIELPVTSKVCANSSIWSIDLDTNRIISSDGLCLGANSQNSGILYNTRCSLISNPQDPRYRWVV